MNRFVKNNLALFAVCGASAVAVLALLVLVAIDYQKMYTYSTEIISLRKQISELINKKPAPVDENKPRIKSDVTLYRKASKEIESYFENPLQPAFDDFIKTLRPEVKQGEFHKKFMEGWKGIDSHNSAQQGVYFKKFQRDYPNWNEAMRAFAKRAGELTTEPIGDQTLDDVFLSLLGVPRHMQYNREKLNTFMSDYRLQALDLLEKAKIVVSANALEFGFHHSNGGFAIDDAPLLAFHWDATGDLVKKLTESGVKELSEMHRRSLVGETVGDYHVYHYAFEVNGPIESIRKLCRLLDTSYAGKRVYIVRSIALFAIHDQAEALFNQEVTQGGLSVEQLDERIRQKEMLEELRRQQIEAAGGGAGNVTAAPQPTPGRRGGSRRGPAAAAPEEQVNTAEVLAQKREQELKTFLATEAAKPFNERYGFGRILIGGTQECRAVISIDYVTRTNVAR